MVPLDSLNAEEPYPPFADQMMLFGQFVGAWDLEVIYHRSDGTSQSSPGEWHFGWVLDGRAVQDVWMVPTRAERQAGRPLLGYGTTVRMYRPETDDWHVTWHGVLSGVIDTFIARRVRDEIVMEATGDLRYRWIFSHITPESFRWRSVSWSERDHRWVLEQEMSARRRR
jgi:hypothetical protein